jgi:hypothetical protein
MIISARRFLEQEPDLKPLQSMPVGYAAGRPGRGADWEVFEVEE